MLVESARAFVDTNVFVYAHDFSAGDKRAAARDLITSLWEQRSGCISVQVLQELYVALTQKVTHPLGSAEAGAIISDLSSWDVCVPGAGDVLDAIALQRRVPVSFWDAMIVHCAAKTGCSILYSEDLGHEDSYDGVRMVDPFA
jgi:predicted nucleic acid-binding protein